MALLGEWHILRAHAKDEGHLERFHLRGQHLCKFIGTKETETSFHEEKTNQFNDLLPVGMLVSLTGRALHRYRRVQEFESRTSLGFLSGFFFAAAKVSYITAMIIIHLKESFYIRKRFNSHRIGLEHRHGRRDVM